MVLTFTNPNYGKQIIALQRAKEAGDVVVTTEEAGLVVGKYRGRDDIRVVYNHPAEICSVEVYDQTDPLKQIERHNTSEPLELAAKLCEKYPSQ